MSGASIAAEVAAALQEVATEVGDGEFLVTLTQDSGEPANPWDTDTSTETETELFALVQSYSANLIDGTLIRAGDKKVMLPATDPKPTTADTLTILGKEYAIISVGTLMPSGVALFHTVQARA